MPPPLQFKLSEQLVVKAAVLDGARFQGFYLVLAVLVAVCSTAYFALTGESAWTWERGALQISLTLVGAFSIAGVVIALVRFAVYPLQARRNFRQQKSLSQNMTLSWTDEDLLLEVGGSRSAVPFANLYGFRASKELVLLYITNNLYHLIPAAAFANQDQLGGFLLRLRESGIRRR